MEKNVSLDIYLLLAYRSAHACLLEVQMESERGKNKGKDELCNQLVLWVGNFKGVSNR